MRDLDTLRTTLEQHASAVVDDDLGARPSAVRERASVVRRRRRAAVTGTAALALAASLGVGQLMSGSDDVEPATPRLVGLSVPTTFDSLGYTYAYADGTEGERLAAVDLSSSDRSRLVSWGTAGADDQVLITRSDAAPERYDVGDFADFVQVPIGVDVTVSVRGEGQVALAVYEITDAAPPGVTRDGVTFRESVAGDRLLDAVIGEPGDAELSASTEAADGRIAYRYFCADAQPGAVLHLGDADGELVVGGCRDGVPFDPGGSGALEKVLAVDGAVDGADVVRLWVTQGEDGPRVASGELVLGLGLYAAAPTTQEVGGLAVADLVEYEGHLWRPVQVVSASPFARKVEVAGTSSPQPRLVVGFADGVGVRSEVSMVMKYEPGGRVSQGVDSGSAPIGLLSLGDTALVSVRGPDESAPSGALLAIVVYEPVG